MSAMVGRAAPRWLAAVCITALLSGLIGIPALAGAVGGNSIPSVSVAGRLAIAVTQPPTTAAGLRTYAPFVVPGVILAGQPVRFAEDRGQISLPGAFDRRPYRWDFGDGTRALARTPEHAFRPGVYRITAWAYVPSYGQWVSFDAVRLRVAAGSDLLRHDLAATDAPGLDALGRAVAEGNLTDALAALRDVHATWTGLRLTAVGPERRGVVDSALEALGRQLGQGDMASARRTARHLLTEVHGLGSGKV